MADRALESQSYLLPIVKCTIKMGLLILFLNLILCPLGTGVAAFSDQRGFNGYFMFLFVI